MSTVS